MERTVSASLNKVNVVGRPLKTDYHGNLFYLASASRYKLLEKTVLCFHKSLVGCDVDIFV